MNLLTTAQVAHALRLSRRRVQALCITGRLGQRVGASYVITDSDLKRFKAKPRKAGRPKK